MTYRTRSDTCIDWIIINVFCFVLFFRFVFSFCFLSREEHTLKRRSRRAEATANGNGTRWTQSRVSAGSERAFRRAAPGAAGKTHPDSGDPETCPSCSTSPASIPFRCSGRRPTVSTIRCHLAPGRFNYC